MSRQGQEPGRFPDFHVCQSVKAMRFGGSAVSRFIHFDGLASVFLWVGDHLVNHGIDHGTAHAREINVGVSICGYFGK